MLHLQFATLTASGVWCRPIWSSHLHLLVFYRLYSFAANFCMFTLGLTQVAQLIQVRHDLDEFNKTVVVSVSNIFAWIKGVSIILTQKRIIFLISMFKNKCCIAQNPEEEKIQKTYDDLSRLMSLGLLVLVEITAFSLILTPLYSGVTKRELVYKVKLPYDLSRPHYYWLTFIHQSIATILTAAISITNDALIAGFMLQVCSQLEILKHRIKQIPLIIRKANEKSKSQDFLQTLERKLLIEQVQHHIQIFNNIFAFRNLRLAEGICTTFYEIVISQFFVSAFAICVSVYQLSVVTSNKIELLSYFLYLICMLQQFFIYCFFGNEITVQSTNVGTTIFNIDWTLLPARVVKDLSMIILRTVKPINMSCGPFIHLTLESFTNIVKLSYSAFNVLKQSA